MTIKEMNKWTKDKVAKFIGANVAEVKQKDKNLFSRIEYTDKAMKKDSKSVTKKDLLGLASDILTLLGDSVKLLDGEPAKPVLAENSTKPQGGKLKVGANSPKAEPKTEPKKEAEPKKEEPKKEPAKPKPEVVGSITADVFPKEIEAEGGKLVLADDILTYEAFKEACSKGELFFFSFYWSKKYIKQFQYGSGYIPAPKEGFSNDLDLADPIYFGEVNDVAYCRSAQTDVLYQIMPEAFDVYDGVRYNMGIECQLYRYVADSKPEK